MFDFLNTIGGLPGLGLLLAGTGFAYAQFKQGGSKAKDDLIDTLKETAMVERDKASRLAEEKQILIKNHQDQINELNKQIGVLQGRADANEKKMNEYLEILKGQSPQQITFMKQTTEILDKIASYMKLQNDEIAKGNDFNKQVEQDTADGVGQVLRKKV